MRIKRFGKRQAMKWAKSSSKYFSGSRRIRMAWVKHRYAKKLIGV